MNVRSICIFFVLMLIAVQGASASIYYDAGYQRIVVSADTDVTLAQLDVDASVGQYISNSGNGVWYLDKILWVRNGGSLDFSSDDISELRISQSGASKTFDMETSTSIKLPDNVVISSWDNTTDTYNPVSVDCNIAGLDSVSNLTFNGIGRLLMVATPDNVVYDGLTFNTPVYMNYPFRIYGSTNVINAPDIYSNNVTINNVVSSGLGLEVSGFDGLDISNVDIVYDETITQDGYVLELDACKNFELSNVDVSVTGSGIHIFGCENGILENIIIHGIWTTVGDKTGGHGIYTGNTGRAGESCENISINDFQIYNMGYGGLELKGLIQHVTATNGIIDTGYHNGVDCRGDYITIDNVIASNYDVSDGQNWHISVVNHSIFKNIVVDGKGIYLNTGMNNTFENVLFKNLRSTTGVEIDRVIGIGNQHNSRFINATFESKENSIQNVLETFNLGTGYFDYDGVDNFSIIDSDLYQFGSTGSNIYFIEANPVNLINVNATIAYYGAATNSDTTIYWYPNIKVVDAGGNPVSGATITADTIVKNGNGDTQTSFTTDSDGKLYNGGNRENWLAVPDYDYDGTTQIDYTVSLTATYDGKSYTISSINPDATWYSPDTSDLQGTLLTFPLDVGGWTPTPGKHYSNVPELHTWNAGSWIITYPETYTDPQTQIIDIEVKP